MDKFLYHPVRNPINQNNLFGADPAYYANLGQAGHPGLDYEAPSGTPLYAPCDGDAFYTSDKYGGDGIWIRVPNNQKPEYNVILWHLFPKGNPQYPFSISTDGSVTSVKAGQLLGYTDNSGAPKESTGPHLHLGVIPCDSTGEALNKNNGYLGCVDPQQFLNGLYAEDVLGLDKLIADTGNVVQAIAQAPISNQDKSSLLDSVKQFLIKVANFLGFKNE